MLVCPAYVGPKFSPVRVTICPPAVEPPTAPTPDTAASDGGGYDVLCCDCPLLWPATVTAQVKLEPIPATA